MRLVEDIDAEINRLKRIEALQSRRPATDEQKFTESDLAHSDPSSSDLRELAKEQRDLLQTMGHRNLATEHATIGFAWSKLEQAIATVRPPIPTSKRITPRFFSLNLGTFNAVCVRDRQDQYAIGFDSQFLADLFLIANLVAIELEPWAENGYIAGNWDRCLKKPLPSNDMLRGLGLLLDSVVSSGSIFSETTTDYIQQFEYKQSDFAAAVWLRLCFFLVGHEYSHFLLDHHSRTDAAPNKNDVDFALRGAERFRDSFGSPTSEQIERFLHHQTNECIADIQSLAFMEVEWNPNTVTGRRKFIVDLLAISIFFAYCDSIERIAVLRIRGKDPETTPLFRQDALFAGLYLREDYPSPYARFRQLIGDLGTRRLGGTDNARFVVSPVWNAFNIPIKLEYADRKYFSRKLSPELVSQKWKTRYSLRSLILNLWPEQDFKRYAEELGMDRVDVPLFQFWKSQPI